MQQQRFTRANTGPKTKKRIAIIGSGPGGSAAAMLLASSGFEVDVFEKEPVVGGRSAELRMGDYRFDLGPTFLMMKFILDELFYSCGRSTSDYLDCRQLETMYELKFGAKTMKVKNGHARMRAEIEKVFPGEGEGLDRFFEREAVRFEKMYPCLRRDYGKISSFFSIGLLKAFPYIAAGRSLYDVLSDYFKSEELRLAFTFQSKYLGMSPWECPGGFAMIPYTEHAHGIYHVMGGLSEIPKAFRRAAEESGARFHLSTPVEQITLERRKVTGVRLRDGQTLPFDDVVVNADFGHAASNLFPQGSLRKWHPEALEKKRFSCSTFMMYLGVDKKFDSELHTIMFADDYRTNIEDISKLRGLSKDASIYVRNASVMDDSVAPEGHSALYVLVPVANNFSRIDWEKEKPAFRDQVLATLEARSAFKGLRGHIVAEKIITPQDWENMGIYKGATFNLSHDISQMLYRRPHNQFEEFSNCYLVGGGTHPGSGLPTIFESARLTTGLICNKYKMKAPRSMPEADSVRASAIAMEI